MWASINPWLLLAAAAAGAAGAWTVQDWRQGYLERERLQQAAKEQGIRLQRGDQAAVGHERDRAQIRTEFVVITEEVERVVEKPFYRDAAAACLDADGLRQLTEALGGAAAAGEPARAVPGPGAAR